MLGIDLFIGDDEMKFVKIDNFEMQTTPITQSQWQEIMGNNPSYFKYHPDNPVEQVSFNDIMEFLSRLNDKNDGYVYRLPTEQEWELASKPCDEQNIMDIAWCCYENSENTTRPVATKKPNSYGLYDMFGNVWEWTSSQEGSYRVMRGGSWGSDAQGLRSGFRYLFGPGLRGNVIGFRLLRTANPLFSNIEDLKKIEVNSSKDGYHYNACKQEIDSMFDDLKKTLAEELKITIKEIIDEPKNIVLEIVWKK